MGIAHPRRSASAQEGGGGTAVTEGVTPSYVRRILRTAFLAPDLKRAILDGSQPPRLTLQAIMTGDIPLSSERQRVLFHR